jgi:hypothetical protein
MLTDGLTMTSPFRNDRPPDGVRVSTVVVDAEVFEGVSGQLVDVWTVGVFHETPPPNATMRASISLRSRRMNFEPFR